MNKLYLVFVLVILLFACQDEPLDNQKLPSDADVDTLAIYFINDQHGQLNNFAKIKHLVDMERDTNEHVLLVCAGDMFSGNPIVDQYDQKGFPMIDIMNKTGFDVSVLGNHEFDYGPQVLSERMQQATFSWVCANVDMQASGVPQPSPFKTLETGNLRVTFLGLVETFGKPDGVIPSTHPWRVMEMKFRRHTDITNEYIDLKSEEKADVFIALTHLGTHADLELPNALPELDAVIGGHSHQFVNETINETSVVQAGSYLSWLGRLQLLVANGEVIDQSTSFYNLNEYTDYDASLKTEIDGYNDAPQFDKVVGYANSYHDKAALGCFYTTALKDYLKVDLSFQNGGGIRSDIDEGDVTALDIYNMDPFNNNSVIFTMTVGQINDFFAETGAGLHTSGLDIQQDGQRIILYRNGQKLENQEVVTIGTNDYIPAVYDKHFPLEQAEILEITTAEALITYLESINSTMDYEGCSRYFRFN
ncbi:MAG: bifunctional UDP-sugar hydrolase/5'-nucleotidase [Marinoscillum sp.]